MQIENFRHRTDRSIVASELIVSRLNEIQPVSTEFPENMAIAPCLTLIIEALEAFQDFSPTIRTAAIALCASELNISQLHFYAIALYADLGGEC